MTSSREQILSKLRAARPELGRFEASDQYLPVVPQPGINSQELLERFVQQAEQLSSVVYQPAAEDEAIQIILEIIGEDRRLMSWSFEHIPVPGLEEALSAQAIQHTVEQDPGARVGLTGVDAVLAATGSLILLTGEGKPRLASLLLPVHVAVVQQGQILADLETWIQTIRQQGLEVFRSLATAMIISGPSRTADIAMQLILGMHGPGELHIVVVK